jgi:hypothetical protein
MAVVRSMAELAPWKLFWLVLSFCCSFKSLYSVAKNGLKATHVWFATGLRRHSLHASLYKPILLIAW